MVDQLSAAYADYLQGSYDCPDRIVLTAYHRLAPRRAAFVTGGDGCMAAMRTWTKRI
ncbi:MAG: hypothetical protein HS114_12525 [Anaerolineales bacterium]|nr:hypothetical protein [Anaerolineales bacterium]